MNNEDTYLSRSRVPKIAEDSWLFYELRMFSYIGPKAKLQLRQARPNELDALNESKHFSNVGKKKSHKKTIYFGEILVI